jgi:hypothetical protein
VGNLDISVSEDLICALFSQIGSVKGCKIIREVKYNVNTLVWLIEGKLEEKNSGAERSQTIFGILMVLK